MPLLFAGLTIPPAATLNRTTAGAAQRQLTAAGARSVVPVTYGEDRLGALVLNVLPAALNSPTLLVQVLWGFAVDGVSDVRLNDQPLPAGSTVTTYLGAQTAPDSALLAAFAAQGITYTDALRGYAYSVVAMPTRSFDGSLNLAGLVRGRRLYDRRLDSSAGGTGPHRLADPGTWTWSDNAALALADWLSNPVYGCGQPVDWASVGAFAAGHCDALIGTPAERRRTIGLSLIASASVTDVAESLRAHAGCWLIPGPAGIRLLPDEDAAPTASYAHANGDIAALEALALRDNSSAPTVVEVVFTDRSKIPWRDAVAAASLPGAGTWRPYRLSQVRMPGVQRYSQAYREAIERLNKLTLGDLSTVVEVFDAGIRHELGDIVTLSHPAGLASQRFRIAEPPEMLGPGRWRLPLVEHDPAIYSTEVVAPPAIPDAGFVSPAGPPGAVTGFQAVAESIGVRLRWAPNPEPDVVQYQLRLGGTSWATATPLDGSSQTVVGGTSHLWAQPAAGSYVFRIRAQDLEGNLSLADAVASITVTSVGSAGPPGPPGASGTQTATVYLYQWGVGSAPADPTSSTAWEWATAAHSGSPGAGWSTTLPTNPGSSGLSLWVAVRTITASASAVSSTVTWAAGTFTKQMLTQNGAAGPSGTPGVRSGFARAFQWSLAPAPTATGSATFTWSTGAVSAPPAGAWSLVAPEAPAQGLTLWQAEVALIDSAASSTSPVNWLTASVRAIGYAGRDGSPGTAAQQGVSARVAYSLAPGGFGGLAATPGAVTVSGDARPASGTWGASTVWVDAPPQPAAGESVWVSDGLFNPSANSTTWYAPYLASLRVGQLSAISANLGAITAGSITINGRTGIAADGYATFRGLRIEDEAGNLVLQTRAGAAVGLSETWIGNLSASKITTGQFGAERIGARAITADKIFLGAVGSNELASESATKVRLVSNLPGFSTTVSIQDENILLGSFAFAGIGEFIETSGSFLCDGPVANVWLRVNGVFLYNSRIFISPNTEARFPTVMVPSLGFSNCEFGATLQGGSDPTTVLFSNIRLNATDIRR